MSEKEPKTVIDPGEEMRLLHERYLVAVSNPLRRKILEALRGDGLTIEDLSSITNLSCELLRWHLSLLESVKCVETCNAADKFVYKLTQAGRVIEFMDK